MIARGYLSEAVPPLPTLGHVTLMILPSHARVERSPWRPDPEDPQRAYVDPEFVAVSGLRRARDQLTVRAGGPLFHSGPALESLDVDRRDGQARVVEVPTHESDARYAMNAESDRRAATRLGRAVRATSDGAAARVPRQPESHQKTNWLRDVILGGQDGLVNILGIILGVIAGGGSDTVLLAAGFAAAITESISMGAVGYTSSISERDYYQAEQAREATEIDTMPDAERQEIRDIYAAKGFTGSCSRTSSTRSRPTARPGWRR